MNNGYYLLDTNILIYHTKGEPEIRNFLEKLSLNGKMNISIINLFVIAFLFQVGMVMESWAGGDDHVAWKVLEESECFFSFSGRAWERGQIMAISKKST